ncbi:MAG: GNAT family N-acetyltransferase [Spirochaetota bacterium]
MKYIKKISGDLCYLSPINTDDYPKYAEWLNDLETAQYLLISGQNITLDSEREYLKSLSKEHSYSIVDQQSDQLIGNCGITSWDAIQGTAEVGIFIGNQDFRGRGYGAEAMYLLLTFAFSYLNIKSVLLRVFSFNERAIRCYEKIGFKQIGRWRSSIEQHGCRYDHIFMDCLPEDLVKP